jgi:hypothetical protein
MILAGRAPGLYDGFCGVLAVKEARESITKEIANESARVARAKTALGVFSAQEPGKV